MNNERIRISKEFRELLDLAKKIYKEQTGEEMSYASITKHLSKSLGVIREEEGFNFEVCVDHDEDE